MGNEIVSGIPLIVVVLGLVEFIKQMGVSGKVLMGVSLGLGLALGLGYQCSVAVPTSYAGWFGAAMYGLGLGLSASGLYDFIDARIPKK